MSDLRTQLKKYFDETAPPVEFEEVTRLIGIRSPKVSGRTASRIPGWVYAFAAAAVVLLIGGLTLLIRPGTEDPADEVTPTTVPAIATTAPAPALLPNLNSLESWQRVGGDIMEPIGGLFDITSTGEGLVAAGVHNGEDGRPDGVILVSDDGFTWTRVAVDDEALTTGAVIMYAITEGGPGLVAVGGGCDDPEESCPLRATAWTSVDGTTWTRTPYDIEVFGTSSLMEEVVLTEDGIVAVGRNEGLGDEGVMIRPAVWISPDGIEWARTWDGEEMVRGQPTSDPPDTGAFVLSPMQAITVGPDGTLVAVGTVVDDSGVGVAAVWTSDDGQTWERVPHDPGVFASSTGMDVVMLDVAAGASGLVAVGSERTHHGAGLWWMGGERPAVWTSPDGSVWERVTLDDETFGTTRSISTVASSATGFVAAGPIFADTGPVTVWSSADGTRWQAVAIFGAGYVSSIIEAGPAMAAAGTAVWMGPAFNPDAPPVDLRLPAPAGEEVEQLPDLDTLEAGLSCEELATTGFSYAAAVAYWMRHDTTADLDPDGNGIPCEADYTGSEIADVFGDPDGLSIRLVSDLSNSPTGTFVATGPAVDAGIVCPTGAVEWTGNQLPPRSGALFRWIDNRYTCDDGSGTFILAADVFIKADGREYGVWDLGSGTGSYQSLSGGGGVATGPTDGDRWSDDSTGRVTTGTDTNS
jgi:hypothetical protein